MTLAATLQIKPKGPRKRATIRRTDHEKLRLRNTFSALLRDHAIRGIFDDVGGQMMKPFEYIAALFIGIFVYVMFVVLLSF